MDLRCDHCSFAFHDFVSFQANLESRSHRPYHQTHLRPGDSADDYVWSLFKRGSASQIWDLSSRD